MDLPARFALAERNTVDDTGLISHPIHRLVEGIDPEAAIASMTKDLNVKGATLALVGGNRAWHRCGSDRWTRGAPH